MPEYLYIDIETIGTADPAEVAASITPPGNMKKPDTIAAWESDTKPELVKEALAKASLKGETGQIICIGFAWNSEPPFAVINADEHALLNEAMGRISASKPLGYYKPCVVGHNVANFDIRFLWQRAFVHGVLMPVWFPRDPKPWSNDVNDTMAMWSGARDFISLDTLCKTLGLPGKGNITGADVARLWDADEFQAIHSYCEGDIERTRAVHKKMLISMGEVPSEQAYA